MFGSFLFLKGLFAMILKQRCQKKSRRFFHIHNIQSQFKNFAVLLINFTETSFRPKQTLNIYCDYFSKKEKKLSKDGVYVPSLPTSLTFTVFLYDRHMSTYLLFSFINLFLIKGKLHSDVIRKYLSCFQGQLKVEDIMFIIRQVL